MIVGGRAFQPTEPARRRAARANLLALLGFMGFATLVPLARAALIDGPAVAAIHWLFLVEACLCPVTGLAAWLVWRRIDIGVDRKRAALRRWGWMLMISAVWPVVSGGMYGKMLALGLLLACLAVAIAAAQAFRRVQPVGAFLLLPYLVTLGGMIAVTIAHY